MQNYHACQQLEQKLLDSRANVSQLMERVQTLADVDQRDRQNFEYVVLAVFEGLLDAKRFGTGEYACFTLILPGKLTLN
jgi:hypothetical protein